MIIDTRCFSFGIGGSVSFNNKTKNTVYSLGFTPPVNATKVVTGVNRVTTLASQTFPERLTDTFGV